MPIATILKKATAILEAAGYKKGSDGIMEKDGKKLAFTIINNSGYSDWIALRSPSCGASCRPWASRSRR